MKKYNNSKVEQHVLLKDGRELFKTHNCFQAWLKTENNIIPITLKYYKKSFKHKIKWITK